MRASLGAFGPAFGGRPAAALHAKSFGTLRVAAEGFALQPLSRSFARLLRCARKFRDFRDFWGLFFGSQKATTSDRNLPKIYRLTPP